MPVIELYLDTSVIGGYYDNEFKDETRKLWQLQKKGGFKFVTSVLTAQELDGAPMKVKRLFAKTFPKPSALLAENKHSEALADSYIEHGVVPEKYYEDALHVAICTINGINYLASWNYKHLTRMEREQAFNDVNLLHSYPSIHILNPGKLLEYYE